MAWACINITNTLCFILTNHSKARARSTVGIPEEAGNFTETHLWHCQVPHHGRHVMKCAHMKYHKYALTHTAFKKIFCNTRQLGPVKIWSSAMLRVNMPKERGIYTVLCIIHIYTAYMYFKNGILKLMKI